VPLRVTVGERGLKDGSLEVQSRRDPQPAKIAVDAVAAAVAEQLQAL
jgi:prolyl-tRNA synthetase